MYSFIVLGLVPGTNFQITFIMWLQALEVIALIVLITVLIARLVKAAAPA